MVQRRKLVDAGASPDIYELLSRDREDGCATGSTIAECGLRIENLLKSSGEQMAKSELLSSISSIVIKNPRSEIPNPRSKPRRT